MPQVSVVIPAYNREGMIARSVASALAQTVTPIEVIVVDDGSTDGTSAVAAEAGARVIEQPNAGHSAARNAGLRAAQAPWVAFLDSDDEWLPFHLETLHPHLRDHLSLVAANAVGVPSGRIVGHPYGRPRSIGARSVMWPDNPLSPSVTVVSRELALQVGGFPGVPFGEDRLLWLALLELRPGMLLPQVTSRYHEHESQVSADRQEMREARSQLVNDLVADGRVTRRVARKIDAAARWDERNSPLGGIDGKTLLRPRLLVALAEQFHYRARLRRRARRAVV